MNKLNIELENCFGIGKLKQEFNFTNTNAYLIYASNGTMKSSFAKTFELIAGKKEKEICDRVYKDRKTLCNIKEDEKDIQPETIFVVNAENNCDSTAKISSFIASKELKTQYDSIYFDLNKEKKELLRQLKKIAISTDCEEEFVTAFRENDKDDFFTCIQKIVNLLEKDPEDFKFKYNDIFDKSGKVKAFLERKKLLLQNYFQEYKKLLSQSSFFNELSDKSFGTHQAEQIKKAVEDNTFFYAGHKFLLKNSTDINSSKDLISLIQNEIDNIFEDEKLKDIFNKIDKELNANKDLRLFKDVIEKDKSLIPRLNDYDKFEKDVLISYFSKLKEDTENLNSLYQSKKKDLQKIIEEAKKQTDIWKNIVDTFNKRFYVPFVVNIKNQDDIILKEKAIPHIDFEYKDVDGKPISREKEELLKILSKGEQRAYYILQMIFEIEARKAQNKETLIIFDDIADSFDYKNKYAIIEYIKDLKDNENKLFKLIILTHNFDFYRTIGSRLDLMKFCLMATKDSSRTINLFSGKYFKDVFNNVFIKRSQEQNKIENKIFISLIPFIRNLIEYCNGSEDLDYLKLTSCLHLKKNTITIVSKDILDIIVRKLNRLKDVKIDFENKKIIDLILETAEEIINDTNINEIYLENKIVLSIAIRLSAEKFMMDKLQFKTEDNNIDKNQTSFLFDKYKETFQGKEFKSQKDSLAEVLMMTTENIHINAFMYEPLIDMSVLHLIDLYKKIKKLNNSNSTEI